MDALLVITNLPDAESARMLAARLVEQRLAACVNLLSPCLSLYRWQGKIEEAEEIPLLIKTSAACYAALEETIRNHHPYELPEIVAVRIDKGLSGYLAWLAKETSAQ